MNQKAIELGLENTAFADPSGLVAENVSSAYDLSRLITFAASDERIGPIMRTTDYKLTTSRRAITIRNTNKLLGETWTSGAARRASSTRPATASPRCSSCPRATRLPSSSSARQNNMLRFMETRHIFNWLNEKAPGLVAAKPPAPQTVVQTL